ncbi:tRNA glutamyl-Q(34) synthetase GluQRS [Rosistilla oblonga]|uniref:tRNA glutamyl-Q(34) synthetase GluQRS n=1 Tax=Rosistilla oblonga TaxID=2527990 RepID=UPI003A96D440
MPQNGPPVGRLAPSPTGAQHLGNARTYILAWLSIRSRGGRVVLRIEDIDSPRVKPWAVQQAIDDLAWLGLDWDEGPDIGGPHQPYIQTQRIDRYSAILDRLRDQELLYPCACTRKDIEEAASAPHEAHDGPVYPDTCAGWRVGDPLPESGHFCWRFRSRRQRVSFVDRVSGPQSKIPHAELGDFPVTRKTGEAAYQLAVVADDIAMGITEVCRGDDLLSSTFRQIDLFDALGHPLPQFVHVPLVVGSDGRRLAKRHGDTRLSYFRERGARPESIVGWALWSAGLIESWQPIQPQEFVESFDLDAIAAGETIVAPTDYQKIIDASF